MPVSVAFLLFLYNKSGNETRPSRIDTISVPSIIIIDLKYDDIASGVNPSFFIIKNYYYKYLPEQYYQNNFSTYFNDAGVGISNPYIKSPSYTLSYYRNWGTYSMYHSLK